MAEAHRKTPRSSRRTGRTGRWRPADRWTRRPGTARRQAGGGVPFGGHGVIGTGVKSKDFKASGKRLVGLLRPHFAMIMLVVVFSICSVTLSTIGPRILGHATNVLFTGVDPEQTAARGHPGAGGGRTEGKGSDAIRGDAVTYDASRRVLQWTLTP